MPQYLDHFCALRLWITACHWQNTNFLGLWTSVCQRQSHLPVSGTVCRVWPGKKLLGVKNFFMEHIHFQKPRVGPAYLKIQRFICTKVKASTLLKKVFICTVTATGDSKSSLSKISSPAINSWTQRSLRPFLPLMRLESYNLWPLSTSSLSTSTLNIHPPHNSHQYLKKQLPSW